MQAIIFDLDGTLVDSAPDIQAAINIMLASEGCEPLDFPTVISFVGNGLPALVDRVIAARGIDVAHTKRVYGDVLALYNASPATLTQLYPDMQTTVLALKADGFKLGICTNKPIEPAMHLLKIKGLAQYFDIVVGGDTTAHRKPHPQPLQTTIDALGADQLLYVGDSEVDAETAVAAGVKFALFTEGYRKSEVGEIPHDFVFSHYDKFPQIVRSAFAK